MVFRRCKAFDGKVRVLTINTGCLLCIVFLEPGSTYDITGVRAHAPRAAALGLSTVAD